MLERNQLYEMVLDNSRDGVCIFDRKGNFVYVNLAVVKSRGLTREQYYTMNVHDIYSSNIIDVCVFDKVCESKRSVTMLQVYRPDGALAREKIVTGAPIYDTHGEITHVFTVIRDVQLFDGLYQTAKRDDMVVCSKESTKPAFSKDFIYTSQKMKELVQVADNVAQLDSTILVTGESGTGKEVFVNYIHEKSHRKSGPLISVNCAAFPENLLESELFGYEKGAFTGASSTGKTGLVEAANGGTLFLDEINSLPLDLQGKLLRVIEEKSIKKVGAVKSHAVDFRLIAATNADLSTLVAEQKFRADLYYRVNVIPLRLPPLRERREDIIPLCKFFLQLYSEKYSRPKKLAKTIYDTCHQYDWPGNVRELKNFIERLVVMTPPNVTLIKHAQDSLLFRDKPSTPSVPLKCNKAHDKLTREKIQEALALHNGHREKTAQYLGVSRRTLQYKVKEFDLL